jgi:phage antirepressor YoqD-like protein
MQELVSIQGGIPVASSLAIAEGTDNDHASVLRILRTYQADFEEFGRVGFEIQPFQTAGGTQTRSVAYVNEDQATLLITYLRNNEIVREFKKRLVKAFRALVNRAHQDVPGPVQVLLTMSRTDMLRFALGMSEEKDALQLKTHQQQATIAVLEPKAQALDRLSNASGLRCVTDAAKSLGMRPSDLFTWLNVNAWIYRRPGGSSWLAYQDRIDQGLLVNKVTTICRPEVGDKVVDRLLVTAKGLAKLSLQIHGRPHESA